MKRTTLFGSGTLLMAATITLNVAAPGDLPLVLRVAFFAGGLSLGVLGVGLLQGWIELDNGSDKELGRAATAVAGTLLAVGALALVGLLALQVYRVA